MSNVRSFNGLYVPKDHESMEPADSFSMVAKADAIVQETDNGVQVVKNRFGSVSTKGDNNVQ